MMNHYGAMGVGGFEHGNQQNTSDGAAVYDFRLETYNPKTHMATVFVFAKNQYATAYCPSLGTNGSGTGFMFRPHDGVNPTGKGFFSHGKTAGFNNRFVISHWDVTADNLPPEPADAEGQKGALIMQTGVVDEAGRTVEPSTSEVWSSQDGSTTRVQMGPEKKRGESQQDNRQVGASVTQAEMKMITASNQLVAASKLASRMKTLADDAEANLDDLARGFSTLGSQFEKAHRSSASSAGALGQQVVGQGEALAIAANADSLAEGNGDYDTF